MGSAPYVRGEAIDTDDSGIIQLGIDRTEKLQIIPTETIQLKTFKEQRIIDLLESIDNSMKTLLIYMQEITGERLEN